MTAEVSHLTRPVAAGHASWTALRRVIPHRLQAAAGTPNRQTAARYAVAGASVVVALAVGLLLQLWDDRVTLFPFFAAVVGSAWLGTGPGSLAGIRSLVPG